MLTFLLNNHERVLTFVVTFRGKVQHLFTVMVLNAAEMTKAGV
jgi:hypothetical protein